MTNVVLRVVLAAASALLAPAGVTHAEPDAPTINVTVQLPCNTAAFDAAWNLVLIGAGGTLTFDLNGNFVTRHFVVNAGAALTLTNITIAGGGGGFYLDAGGAVQNFGALTVLTSTFHTNQTGDNYGGGAIYSRGRLVIDNSIFRNNYAGNGGAIYNERVGNSQGYAMIQNTQIVSNTARNGRGGGIYNSADLVDMTNVTIQGNRAVGLSLGYGGGIYNSGNLNYLDGVVSLNEAEEDGGGIENRAFMELSHVLIEKNRAVYDGAGMSARGSTNTCFNYMDAVTLNENSAGLDGGGVAVHSNCFVYVTNSTMSANTASNGGGLWLGSESVSAKVKNTTIAMNRATDRGGGVFNTSKLELTNVTLMQNQSPAGAGGGVYAQDGVTVVLVNTIIADSPAGGNCGGPAILSAVYTLSSDDTCTLSGPGNKSNTDPMLSPLGDYGGPTLTYLPKAGSPAIDGVIGSNAPVTDQRGFPRPQGAGYDIGAVERQPGDSDLSPRVRIPILTR